MRYVKLIMAQRRGPVIIDPSEGHGDLTIMDVPTECVGYVTGRHGAVLRKIEDDWGTLMFFGKTKDAGDDDGEVLAIFGDKRGRRGAELKVYSALEHKKPGYVVAVTDGGSEPIRGMVSADDGCVLPECLRPIHAFHPKCSHLPPLLLRHTQPTHTS